MGLKACFTTTTRGWMEETLPEITGVTQYYSNCCLGSIEG